MRIHYDADADALYIRFSEEKYLVSEELPNGLILDYDKKRRIMGIEVLFASKILPAKSLQQVSFELLKSKTRA